MTSQYKCQAPTCEKDVDKAIVIPKIAGGRQEFLSIGLCKYHYERFEELYEENQMNLMRMPMQRTWDNYVHKYQKITISKNHDNNSYNT